MKKFFMLISLCGYIFFAGAAASLTDPVELKGILPGELGRVLSTLQTIKVPCRVDGRFDVFFPFASRPYAACQGRVWVDRDDFSLARYYVRQYGRCMYYQRLDHFLPDGTKIELLELDEIRADCLPEAEEILRRWPVVYAEREGMIFVDRAKYRPVRDKLSARGLFWYPELEKLFVICWNEPTLRARAKLVLHEQPIRQEPKEYRGRDSSGVWRTGYISSELLGEPMEETEEEWRLNKKLERLKDYALKLDRIYEVEVRALTLRRFCITVLSLEDFFWSEAEKEQVRQVYREREKEEPECLFATPTEMNAEDPEA